MTQRQIQQDRWYERENSSVSTGVVKDKKLAMTMAQFAAKVCITGMACAESFERFSFTKL